MADISELVKRMRGLAEYVDDCDEAADALEAQAKEMKIYQQTELTYVTRVADAQREYSEMQAKLKARIAELEAALEKISDTDPDDGTAWFHEVARAALSGEKR